MKFIRCPKCGDMIDIEELNEIAGTGKEIIGCGYAEKEFLLCDDCSKEYGKKDCLEEVTSYDEK